MQNRSLLLISLLAPAAALLVASSGGQSAHSKRLRKSVASATKVAPAIADTTYETKVLPLVAKYCGSCHGAKEGTAGLSLLAFKRQADVLRSRSEWEKVSQNISSAHMPPQGTPQPTQAERDLMTGWIDSTLSKSDCNLNDPGHITMRRLNRDEYNNTIRDLTGLDIHPADEFPSDDVGYGFDNIGDVLSISPLLMDKYIDAAEKIAQAAIVTPEQAHKTKHIAAALFQGAGGADGNSRSLSSGGEGGLRFRFCGGRRLSLALRGVWRAGWKRTRENDGSAGRQGRKNFGRPCHARQPRRL